MTDDQKQPTALEGRQARQAQLFSPSVARNRDPILNAFTDHMPRSGKTLEIGGGTGEHAVHLAGALPQMEWLTGDPDAAARASIAAWIDAAGLPNLKGPHSIDVTAEAWGVEDRAPFDGVVSINMIHIAPFAAAEGLLKGAARLLRPSGKLFLYGPYAREGKHVAASNEAFDASLKSRNPAWGVRDLEHEIVPLAQKNALVLERVVEMPANNFSVIFKKN